MKRSLLKSILLSASLLLILNYSEAQSQKELKIENGSGSFTISGGYQNEKDSIEIHYYKPKDYKPDFSVMIVLPGGGRNGDTYRDTWVALAEEYDLLILSPSYSRDYYPRVGDYNLGRVTKSSLFAKKGKKPATNSEPWIFDDFDRIFNIAIEITGSTQSGYDVFGHSAGGQIAHRLALFNPNTKAKRIVAANSGWYTLPLKSESFPYGFKKTTITDSQLEKAFGTELIVFLGELDNENETRGHLRKTKQAKKQGSGRVQRGTYFYDIALEEAKRIGCRLNWKKHIVPKVGHSYWKMGTAAASYLYGKNN